MVKPTPTVDRNLPRRFADFDTLVEAVDYAARGGKGLNFYSGRGELVQSLPYAELRERAIKAARRLMALGVKRGDRVALLADTSPAFISLFLGCQYAAVLPVPLPLPTSFGGREGYCQQLHRQMSSCAASVALAPREMIDFVRQAAEGLKMDFIGTHREFAEIAPSSAPLRTPKHDDTCYLQYSSGSTRFPHGVAVSHRSLLANCHGMGKHGVQLVDDDRLVTWLPMYHDMGLVGCLLTPLCCQVSVDYLATEDFARRPMQWLKLMSKNRGTISYSPSLGYELCARRAGADALASLDLSPWRVAGIGADMIRADVMRDFLRVFEPAGFSDKTFVASYGLAECTLAVSFAPVRTGLEIDVVDERQLANDKKATPHQGGINGVNGGTCREVVNCGVPLPGYELEIRDETGSLVGEREVGQIFVRGNSVMSGYFGDAEATAQVLSADGWLDTGDMGYRVGNALYIVGRTKDLIIVNGRNHWPQDIEWVVEQLPGLRSGDSAAISIPGQNDEEVATLVVQCRLRGLDDRQMLINDIKKSVQKSLGINCQVALVPPRTLPRTSSGKLSRSKARDNMLKGMLTPIEASDPVLARL